MFLWTHIFACAWFINGCPTNIPLITRAKFPGPIRMKRVYIHIRVILSFMDIIRSIFLLLKMAETWVVKASSLSTSQGCI